MKKILFAISNSIEFGGAQKLFIATIKELAKMDAKISVILPDVKLAVLLKDCDVTTYIVDFQSIKSVIAIHKILKENEFDVINTYLPQCGLLISLINLFHRIPIFCTLLNAIIHEKSNYFQKTFYPFVYFCLHKVSDGFIVNSEHNKQHFINKGRINENFIKVIYSGVEIDEFRNLPKKINEEGKLVLGYVGRLSPEKGPLYFLKALTYLKGIDYKCKIVGDGPLRGEMENYVLMNRLNDKVKFYGYQHSVPRFMNKMDVVIVPSLNETFGLTIIEAFALKKAVIASEVGGIPEVVKNETTGLLFPAKNVAALSEKIQFVHDNKEQTEKMIKNGHEVFLQNFTCTIMAKNTFNFFNAVTKN